MRKPRDYDAELKALDDKAKRLKTLKVQQYGELVITTGADTLPIEQLVGALLQAAETKDAAAKEGWRKRGVAFFQRTRAAGRDNAGHARGAAAGDSGAPPTPGEGRA